MSRLLMRLARSLLARLFVELDHCGAFTLTIFDAMQTGIQCGQLNMDFFEIGRLLLYLMPIPTKHLPSVPWPDSACRSGNAPPPKPGRSVCAFSRYLAASSILPS